jgi:hypothetical protein
MNPEEVYNQTKARCEAMTIAEKQDEKMRFLRGIRNQKLKESDKYINQMDRYTNQQIDELKNYRQLLRDLPIIYSDILKLDAIVEYPEEPEFIREFALQYPPKL